MTYAARGLGASSGRAPTSVIPGGFLHGRLWQEPIGQRARRSRSLNSNLRSRRRMTTTRSCLPRAELGVL